MTQSQTEQQVPQFNYASLEPSQGFLPELRLEEKKQALVNFLSDIPGMQNPPFVFCRIHWISEYGENGRYIQCHGGSCCEQVTWQKGWGGEPGKFAATGKPRTRYYIPIVHYEPDPKNPAATIATIKYLNMSYQAYDMLLKQVNNNEGLDFFDRDCAIEATKVNGATVYNIYKKDTQALWKTNEIFKEQVESQLPTVAEKLLASMPKLMTEAEFMELKPSLDAKVQQAMTSQMAAQQMQPIAQPVQQAFTQPQVNIPVTQQMQPIAQPVQQAFTQPQVNIPVAQPVQQAFTQPQVNIPVTATPVTDAVQTPATQEVLSATQTTMMTEAAQAIPTEPAVAQEIPQVSLNFDPSALLK